MPERESIPEIQRVILAPEEEQRLVQFCRRIPAEEWTGSLNNLRYSFDSGMEFYFVLDVLLSDDALNNKYFETLRIRDQTNPDFHCILDGENNGELYDTVRKKVAEYRHRKFQSSLDELFGEIE